jgi:hypothetical protein
VTAHTSAHIDVAPPGAPTRRFAMTRSPLRLLVLLVTAALGAVLLAPSASAGAAPYCGITWGSLAKSGTHDPGGDTLRNVRAGQHTCYDRLVIDLARAPHFTAYSVKYGTAYEQGSGKALSLRGTDMQIVLDSPAYDTNGTATYTPVSKSEVVNVSGFRTFEQVAWGGSFEGKTTIGLGVRARLPFRVTVLEGSPGHPTGARVIVDVAHAW